MLYADIDIALPAEESETDAGVTEEIELDAGVAEEIDAGPGPSLTGTLYAMRTEVTSVDDDGGVSQTGPQWRIFFVQNDDGDFIETLTNPGDFQVDDFVLAQEGFGTSALIDDQGRNRENADYQRGFEFPEFLDCNSENTSYPDLNECNLNNDADGTSQWNITLNEISVSLPNTWNVHHAQVQTPFVGQVWYDNQDQIRVEFGNLQQINADGPEVRYFVPIGDSDCGWLRL